MSNDNLIPAGHEATIASPNPVKKRRNLPGNPDPDAEVIALSPKSLMATNRFMCEVCNKGFQREQNLQLHRRGHNLPWKLNKRPVLIVKSNSSNIDNNEEEVEIVVVKKKVYVCPEEGCVHHQASRALGDLTGIKKHFSRKHGEKRFKCDKCSKKYAVHSDWKAHSKTCGTREYKCDCGTIFSRRDSFVTHRAFCDALAEESSRSINNPPPLLFTPPHQPSPSLNSNSTFPLINDAIHDEHLSAKTSDIHQNNFNMRHLQTQPLHNIMLPLPFSLPPSLLPSSSSSSSSHLSATALLQKAAEMGATMSSNTSSRPIISTSMATHHTSTTSFLQEMMMMMPTAAGSAEPPELGFDGYGGMMGSNNRTILSDDKNYQDNISSSNKNKVDVLKSEGLTRDFLGLKALSHAGIFSMAGSLHYDKMN